jgi:hypothetical protein
MGVSCVPHKLLKVVTRLSYTCLSTEEGVPGHRQDLFTKGRYRKVAAFFMAGIFDRLYLCID